MRFFILIVLVRFRSYDLVIMFYFFFLNNCYKKYLIGIRKILNIGIKKGVYYVLFILNVL